MNRLLGSNLNRINFIRRVPASLSLRQLHGRTFNPLPPSSERLGKYQTPQDLLAAIGRSSETKLKVETWDDLWRMRGGEMKQAGLTPAERRYTARYILWALEKIRQGYDPAKIAIKEKPKKTIRG
ncbi:unnamed protein product [Rhizoctonia solani]|uniref:Small ribosomal subunit protein mS41 n=1 Tax=Rhizoctonia solani TaxID=456999 RepID=A0A8H3AID9_9AGAM|nr:unnamed protein product [Rhizoctonia solani]